MKFCLNNSKIIIFIYILVSAKTNLSVCRYLLKDPVPVNMMRLRVREQIVQSQHYNSQKHVAVIQNKLTCNEIGSLRKTTIPSKLGNISNLNKKHKSKNRSSKKKG